MAGHQRKATVKGTTAEQSGSEAEQSGGRRSTGASVGAEAREGPKQGQGPGPGPTLLVHRRSTTLHHRRNTAGTSFGRFAAAQMGTWVTKLMTGNKRKYTLNLDERKLLAPKSKIDASAEL